MRRAPEAGEATPTAASEWQTVYAQTRVEARDSASVAVDKALADFAQRYPASPEAAEVPYWRAVLKLDPANPTALREALAMLDAYLASTPAGMHRAEAATLRRLGLALEQRTAALAAIPPATARPDDKAREEEVQKLRDDLAAANAELDRIRRRLARPTRRP